jgi:hypothetical protein
MGADGNQAWPLHAIRREAEIQLGLGLLALVAAAAGTWWLLQGRLHPTVWPGVAGALTLAVAFLSEGRRTRAEYTSSRHPSACSTGITLATFGTARQGRLATDSRRRLHVMVFGIVASVGGPGLNVLVGIVTRGGAGTIDLVAWMLFTLPIALAVWMLPPRGLAPRSAPRAGKQMAVEKAAAPSCPFARY